MNKILSLGDCNTLGIDHCKYNAYPERLAQMMKADVKNCGYTMSTLREAENFFKDFYDEKTNIVTIHYGLVDSWETFKYSPYVLYYPDNPLRKIARKLVKKYKKICRKTGLNDRIGTKHVIEPDDFTKRLNAILKECHPSTHIVLIEALPSVYLSRNKRIQTYNRLTKKVAESDNRCTFLEIHNHFLNHIDTLYLDMTHINSEGHDVIAHKLFELLKDKR